MSENDATHVLLVGHCMPDSFGLSRAVKKALPGAKVDRVNSDAALRKAMSGADLLLINRALDGRFLDADGVDMIRRLRLEANGRAPGMALVSNFPEAQQAAEEAGASPGVGKSDLKSEEALRRIAESARSA
jgi:CheY-like chemotaxis protein